MVYRQPAIAIPVLSLNTTTKVFARPTAAQGEVFIRAEAINKIGLLTSFSPEDPIFQILHLIFNYFNIDHLPACEIQITSTLPIASGMGSSASLSISLIKAVSEFIGHSLTVDEINQLAFEAEKIHHGNPSGIDNTVIAYQLPVYYTKGNAPEFLTVKEPIQFVMANTGISASTAAAVQGVHDRWQNHTQRYEDLFSEIGKITREIRECLATADIEKIGKLISRNHSLLCEMEVSCLQLDNLVNAANASGALGAKLSGGGLGGNMLALVTPDTIDGVTNGLIEAGAVNTVRITLPRSTE